MTLGGTSALNEQLPTIPCDAVDLKQKPGKTSSVYKLLHCVSFYEFARLWRSNVPIRFFVMLFAFRVCLIGIKTCRACQQQLLNASLEQPPGPDASTTS